MSLVAAQVKFPLRQFGTQEPPREQAGHPALRGLRWIADPFSCSPGALRHLQGLGKEVPGPLQGRRRAQLSRAFQPHSPTAERGTGSIQPPGEGALVGGGELDLTAAPHFLRLVVTEPLLTPHLKANGERLPCFGCNLSPLSSADLTVLHPAVDDLGQGLLVPLSQSGTALPPVPERWFGSHPESSHSKVDGRKPFPKGTPINWASVVFLSSKLLSYSYECFQNLRLALCHLRRGIPPSGPGQAGRPLP